MREALRDALADLESFLIQVPSIPSKDDGASCPNVIWYNSKYNASPSLLKICSLRITDMIDPCITQGTMGPHTSREYKSTWGLL